MTVHALTGSHKRPNQDCSASSRTRLPSDLTQASKRRHRTVGNLSLRQSPLGPQIENATNRRGNAEFAPAPGPGLPKLEVRAEHAAERRCHGLAGCCRAEGVPPDRPGHRVAAVAFAPRGCFRWRHAGRQAAYGLLSGQLGGPVQCRRSGTEPGISTPPARAACLSSQATGWRGGAGRTILKGRLRFDPVGGEGDGPPGRNCRQNRGEALRRFLTPALGERVKPLPSLGVSAQALNYLNFLIRSGPRSTRALYRSGRPGVSSAPSVCHPQAHRGDRRGGRPESGRKSARTGARPRS